LHIADPDASTLVIFVILLVFMFKVMASNSLPILGSPGALWDLFQSDVIQTQAYGAKDGSYLTMQSGEGLILAAVILVSGFSSVFVDPAYGKKRLLASLALSLRVISMGHSRGFRFRWVFAQQ
jgi:hypothetical protein